MGRRLLSCQRVRGKRDHLRERVLLVELAEVIASRGRNEAKQTQIGVGRWAADHGRWEFKHG